VVSDLDRGEVGVSRHLEADTRHLLVGEARSGHGPLGGVGAQDDQGGVDARQRHGSIERAVEHVGRVERGRELGGVAKPVGELLDARLDRRSRPHDQDHGSHRGDRHQRERDDEPRAHG
jgi:hypothetical protein